MARRLDNTERLTVGITTERAETRLIQYLLEENIKQKYRADKIGNYEKKNLLLI